ncbi:MAG: EAL domain-containing protein [Clostridiales bacterium]|nr:EAL domain-containing protein [Roseburia sp.]MDD7637101.1 EAL domain-containing protein [Clostridiales bacterium]MDY4111899.1 EAL domain-containing protein [Roseburia sp.]
MTGKNKVLIVDDAEIDRIALRKILNDDYEIVEAENGQQALNILDAQTERDTIAAVLLDLVMPELSGYQFMQEYQKIETYRRIPVIVATVEGDLATERECLELGAWDFVSKPYDPMVIRFRLKNVIERSQQQLSKELKYRADYDTLTGIYNKTKFFERTKTLLSNNPDEKFVFLRIDVAKFQLVNTFFGVQEGDKLLCYMADEIRCFVGHSVRISYGRVEADIFCICMPYQSEQTLLEFIRYVRMRIGQYNLEYDIVPTIGIYVIEDRELSVDGMYDRANLAAKKCKGNYIRNYAFYTADMSEELVKEQRIVNSMRSALEGNEFILYLQPKYGLQDNAMEGAEVLVRWNSPSRGMVSPGEFIPVFERNGFITKLDYYVWEKTCQLIAKWLKEGKNPEPVSVNISRVSLYNPRLVEIICGLVEKYQIPPRLLQLELTESAYTNNPQAIREMMEKFQKAGFSILMDDFGSGYSSLNVLKDIAVDILKIDMKFLSDTGKQGRSENILASVVRMAKWLDMPVVAEGVERREQVDFLRSIGCEYVQGYYFAKPMPVEDYEELAFERAGEHQAQEIHEELNADSLWTSTSQMEILFSNMLQAVAVYEYENDTENLDVIRVNNAYYELFGYNDINDVQKSLLTSVDADGRNILMSAFREAVETKAMSDCEFMRRVESGKEIWIQLKLKYINQVGKKHVIFGTITDVTEQKEIDRELQKYRMAFATKPHGEKTILVVDDVEVNRMSIRCIFEEQYRVLEAENGKEALEFLNAHPGEVDVILLDLMMPVMDGNEFLRHKQSDAAISGIPVIIITSDDTTRRQVQAMELGADDYIVKPFIPEIAIRRVHNVLEAQRRLEHTLKKYQDMLEQPKEEVPEREPQKRDESVKALMIVEMNNIVEIADAYSYKVAEQIACVVENRLKRHFPQGDILARCGRKECIVSFADSASREKLERQCGIFLEDVRNIGADGITLDCSVGVAIAQDGEPAVLILMEKADRALCAAMQAGNNQFVIV